MAGGEFVLKMLYLQESPKVEKTDCCSNPDIPECMAIFVEKDDPLFATLPCFNIKRSIPAQAILGNS